jgi:hypothetical protein
MMRLLSLFLFAGALAVAAASARADSAEQAPFAEKVSITSAVDGPFDAAGRSICTTGGVATTYNFNVGSFPNGFDLVVGKTFTCDDGSGTLDVVVTVQVRPQEARNNFRWMITDGTGRYARTLGSGTGFGDPVDGLDHYTGRVRTEP